jgi:hypothetical protein
MREAGIGRAPHARARAIEVAARLRRAAERSPAWLASLGVHAVVLALASTLVTVAVPVSTPVEVPLPTMGAVEPPAEVESPVAEVETWQNHDADLRTTPPTWIDAPLDDYPETDNGLDAKEELGSGGISDGVLEGPGNVSLYGIGGGRADAFVGRGHRNLRTGCCGGRAEDAVEESLKWLAAHQSPDGGWECAGFPAWCEGEPSEAIIPDGPGMAAYDVGVTGLSLLAFLGAGYTNRSEGPFGRVAASHLSCATSPRAILVVQQAPREAAHEAILGEQRDRVEGGERHGLMPSSCRGAWNRSSATSQARSSPAAA